MRKKLISSNIIFRVIFSICFTKIFDKWINFFLKKFFLNFEGKKIDIVEYYFSSNFLDLFYKNKVWINFF